MTELYDKNTAVVVLPPIHGGGLTDASLRVWLAKADFVQLERPQELLLQVTAELNLPYPKDGLAALRMWGQTGDRPTRWIAAADPVYLEPRLDHLCVHALCRVGVAATDMRALIDYLQETLGVDNDYGFARLGTYSYVSAKNAFATSDIPAHVVHQQSAGDFLPSGEGSDLARNLISEIEMSLHEHEVNEARVADGLQPVNSLWLWGGGIAPQKVTRPQPPLFADDALLTGYWYAATAVAEAWPGDIAGCLDASVAGFVAVTPEFDNRPEVLAYCLHELREALQSGRLSRLKLLFRDGVVATLDNSHRYRFWRRKSPFIE